MGAATSVSSPTISQENVFSEELDLYLRENPKNYDITFFVGPAKEVVQHVKLILEVASTKLRFMFQKNWTNPYIPEYKEGIPLPHVDANAFRLLLKLLPCETLSVQSFTTLNLSAKELLNLLDVCEKFGTPKIQHCLQPLVTSFFENLEVFMESQSSELLDLSRNNIQNILSNSHLTMNELQVFKHVKRWAEHQCIRQGLEITGQNLRSVLGESLFEVRFPLMTMESINNEVRNSNILTENEMSELLRYMAMGSDKEDQDRNCVDLIKLGLKVPKLPTTRETQWSTVRFFEESQIIHEPHPYLPYHIGPSEIQFSVDVRIELLGFGFLGPITEDADYDVTFRCSGITKHFQEDQLHIYIDSRKNKTVVDSSAEPSQLPATPADTYQIIGTQKKWITHREVYQNCRKQIHAKRLEKFYALFDEPVVINSWKKETAYFCCVSFTLEGPNTSMFSFSHKFSETNPYKFTKTQDGVTFNCSWMSSQLESLIFRKI